MYSTEAIHTEKRITPHCCDTTLANHKRKPKERMRFYRNKNTSPTVCPIMLCRIPIVAHYQRFVNKKLEFELQIKFATKFSYEQK